MTVPEGPDLQEYLDLLEKWDARDGSHDSEQVMAKPKVWLARSRWIQYGGVLRFIAHL